jgi:hypothetical protein
VPVAKGHVIAYNFNPMHRDLNRSDYRLLWNAELAGHRALRSGTGISLSPFLRGRDA